MLVFSGTGTPPNINEKARISSANSSVQCTLKPPPPLLEGSPTSPTLPVCALLKAVASRFDLNITPVGNWFLPGFHPGFPSKLLPISSPPLPTQLLSATLLKHNTIPSHC